MRDRIRILFADDHIPDKKILDMTTCSEIRDALRGKYNPTTIDGWTYSYYAATSAIRGLKSPEYDLITACNKEEAKRLIANNIDIAIVDIGWYNDDTLGDQDDKGEVGWEIARCAGQQTALIAYSSRFRREPQLAIKAAELGMLPFFKMDTNTRAEDTQRESQSDEAFERRCEATAKALCASVQFLTSIPQRVRQEMLRSFMEANRLAGRWQKASLCVAVTSAALILAGVILAFIGKSDIGVISSASSIITGAVASLLFRESSKARTRVTEGRRILMGEQHH